MTPGRDQGFESEENQRSLKVGDCHSPDARALKADSASPLRFSRRALLEGSASSALGAAALGWSSPVIGAGYYKICRFRRRRVATSDGNLPHPSGGSAGISR